MSKKVWTNNMSYVIITSALDELFYKQEWELNQVKDASQVELTILDFAHTRIGEEVLHFGLKG